MWRDIETAWREAGRSGNPRWVGASYYALGPNAAEQASRYIQANYGYNPELAARRMKSLPATQDALADAIRRQADMGVDEFILRPCAEDLDQLDRLGEVTSRMAGGGVK